MSKNVLGFFTPYLTVLKSYFFRYPENATTPDGIIINQHFCLLIRVFTHFFTFGLDSILCLVITEYNDKFITNIVIFLLYEMRHLTFCVNYK